MQLPKILKRLFIGVLLLFAIILMIVWFVLGTKTGSAFLVQQLNQHQTWVKASYVDGSVISGLQLQDVLFQPPEKLKTKLPKVQMASFSYQLSNIWSLFEGKISVASLQFSDIDVRLPLATKKEEAVQVETPPFSFKTTKWPLKIDIHTLVIHNLALKQLQNGESIDQAENDKGAIKILLNLTELSANIQMHPSTWQFRLQKIDMEWYLPKAYGEINGKIEALIQTQKDYVILKSALDTRLYLQSHEEKLRLNQPSNQMVMKAALQVANVKIAQQQFLQNKINTSALLIAGLPPMTSKNIMALPVHEPILSRIDLNVLGTLEQLAFTTLIQSDLTYFNLAPIQFTSSATLEHYKRINFIAHLSNEDSTFEFKGWLDRMQHANLSVKSTISDFSKFLPNMQGSLLSDLNIKGQFPQLAVTGNAQIENFIYQHQTERFELENLRLDSDVDEQLQGKLHLQAKGLRAKNQMVHRVDLIAEAKEDIHSLELELEHDKVKLKIQLLGNLHTVKPFAKDQLLWQGQWKTLDLELLNYGRLQLQNAPELVVSLNKVALLDPLCLLNAQTKICVNAEKNQDYSQIKLEIDDASLPSLLNTKLKNAKVQTKLQANFDLSIESGKKLELQSSIHLAPGTLSYVYQGHKINIPLQKTQLQISGNEQELTAGLALDWGSYLQGESNVRLQEVFSEKTLSGQGQFTVQDLKWARGLIPNVRRLDGKINSQFLLSGSIAQPKYEVNIALEEGQVRIPRYRTNLSDLNLEITLPQDASALNLNGRFKMADGQANIKGALGLKEASLNLELQGENLLVADTDEMKIKIAPNIRLYGGPGDLTLGGDLQVSEATIKLGNAKKSTKVIKPSSDIRIINDQKPEKTDFFGALKMDFGIGLQHIMVDYDDLSGELQGELQLNKLKGQPIRATGDINIGAGDYVIYGQKLALKKGKVLFGGGLINNPSLDIEAARQIRDSRSGREVTAGVRILGSLNRPRLTLYGTPSMPETSVVSYLLLGRAPDGQSDAEMLMLLNALRRLGNNDKSDPVSSIAESMHLDELGITQDSSGNAAFGIGKNVTDKLYIGYALGVMDGYSVFKLRYQINRWLNLDAESGEEGTNVDLLYTKERE